MLEGRRCRKGVHLEFKRILCLADSAGTTHDAMKEAGCLAEKHEAALTFLYVLPKQAPLSVLFPHRHEWNTMQKPRWIGAIGGLCERVRKVTGLQGRKFDVVVETGSADTAISVAARECDPDLIVIPGNLASEKILKRAPCAVLIVRQSGGHGVLAATDLSDPSHPALTAASEAAESSGEPLFGMFGLHIPEIATLGVWGTRSGRR